jgi:hypothetical protein
LIPNPVITYTNPNSTGSLSFAPAANVSGTATITITVSDGQSLNSTISRSFTVTVNNPPTLNPLSNLNINQDSPLQSISLNGISSGAANEVQTLQVTASSSNPGLIPVPSISYSSPNASGTLTFKPVAGATGSAVITVSVNDGQVGNNSISRSFTVTVNAVAPNIAPTLNAIGNIVVAQNSGASTVPLSGIATGSSSEVQPLTVTATSSNPALIPNPVVSYTSPNATGTLSFTPAPNTSGTASITVTVSDGQALNSTTSRSFVVTANNPPTLSPLGNLTISQGAPAQTVALSGITAGGSGEVQTIQMSVTSSNPALVPTPAINYASPSSSGTLVFQPAAGGTGSAVIAVTVNDGQVGNNLLVRSFTVTVNPAAPNVAPTLNSLATVAVTQNSGTRNVLLSGISSGSSTEIQPLSVTATSSNPALIPNPVITYTSPNSTGSLSFTPSANTFGTATITVTVSDGQALNGTASRSFAVIVNNPPTLNQPANMTIPVNSRSQAVSLLGISSGAANEVQPITITAASSNTGLIPTPAIFYSSPNPSGVVYFTPVANVSGSATITVTVRDGQAANNVASRSFVVTVSAAVQSLSAFSVEGDMSGEPPSEAPAVSTDSPTKGSSEMVVSSDPAPDVVPASETTQPAPESPAVPAAAETTVPSENAASNEPVPDVVQTSEITEPAEQQPIVFTEPPATETVASAESNLPVVVENPEIAPAAESVGPQVSGLLVASSDARSLVLSWQTDKPATCFLEFGATDALEWVTSSTFGTTHTITLQNLQPATLYYMRVQAADADNHFTGHRNLQCRDSRSQCPRLGGRKC